MKKLQSSAKMMLFLLWFAPGQKGVMSWTISIAVFVFGVFLGAPFDNVPYLYSLSKETQMKLRTIGVLLSFVLFSLIFLLIYFKQRKKYSDIPNLTKEELDALNKYLNIKKKVRIGVVG